MGKSDIGNSLFAIYDENVGDSREPIKFPRHSVVGNGLFV